MSQKLHALLAFLSIASIAFAQPDRWQQKVKYTMDINMDVTNRNHIVGNARFLRALGYFDLVRNFGDVPLLLRPIASAGDSLLFPSRAPAAEVYKTIIEDLQFAEANCLAENKIPGPPNST